MSQKSERKKQNKAEKQAALPPQPPQKWYAEDVAEYLEHHREHCSDPKCSEQALTINPPGKKMVAMLYPQKLNEIFFAVYGTGTDEDYQPFMSLQLANPEDIRVLFDADGNLGCFLGSNHNGKPSCLTFLCHREGAVIAIEPNLPGVVTIRCKTCGNWLRSKGLAQEFQLAPQPKAEWPNIFCPEHGIEPRYIICRHVLEEGKYPAWLWASDAENPGEALCEDCGAMREDGSLFEKANHDLWACGCQSGLDKQLHGRLKEMLEAVGQSLYVPPSSPVASAA